MRSRPPPLESRAGSRARSRTSQPPAQTARRRHQSPARGAAQTAQMSPRINKEGWWRSVLDARGRQPRNNSRRPWEFRSMTPSRAARQLARVFRGHVQFPSCFKNCSNAVSNAASTCERDLRAFRMHSYGVIALYCFLRARWPDHAPKLIREAPRGAHKQPQAFRMH